VLSDNPVQLLSMVPLLDQRLIVELALARGFLNGSMLISTRSTLWPGSRGLVRLRMWSEVEDVE